MSLRSLLHSVSLVALLGACASDDKKDDVVLERVAEPTGSLPLVISLQGSYEQLGSEQLRGARIAEQQINAVGGIFGKPVLITVLDDGSDRGRALGLLPAIQGSGLPVAIGPTGNEAALDLRNAAGNVLFVSPSATSSLLDLAPSSPVSLFRTASTDGLQAHAIARAAAESAANETTKCSSLSIVSSDDAYGTPLAGGVTQSFTARGLTARGNTIPTVLQAPSFYDGVAGTLVSLELQCQLVVASPQVAAEYMRAFRRVQQEFPRRPWDQFTTIASDAMHTDAFLAAMRENPQDPSSRSLAEGVRIVAAETEPDTAQRNAFRSLFLAQFPGESVGRAGNAYDAVIVTALALTAAGPGANVDQVRQALFDVSKGGRAVGPANLADALAASARREDIDYVGASGSVDFDERGEVQNDFLVWQVKDGKFEQVARYKPADLAD